MARYHIEGDPRATDVAIKAMAARIDSVVSLCKSCSAFDKLVATAMAQNGDGFSKGEMNYILRQFRNDDGSIDWNDYFNTRDYKARFSDLRAFGRENFNTRYMVYLYALDMYSLYKLDGTFQRVLPNKT